MTSLSYDLPDTATRKLMREALELRQKTLEGHLLLHADAMIELSTKLINPDDPKEIYLTVHDIAAELQRVIRISQEMQGILDELEGL